MPPKTSRPVPTGTEMIVFAVALGVRLLYLLESRDAPNFHVPIVDGASYHALAARWAAGEGTPATLFWQPVLYPTWLMLLYRVTGPSVIAAKLAQAFLGAVTAALTARLGTRTFGRGTGLAAGLIVAGYAPLFFFEGMLVAAGPAALAGVSLLLLTPRGAPDAPSVPRAVLLGAVAAIAVLTRPTFLPFVLLLGVAGLLRRAVPLSRRALTTAAAAAAFAMVVVPFAALNRAASGHFGFLPASGGANLWIGNNPDAAATIAVRTGEGWFRLLDSVTEEAAGHRDLQEAQAVFLERTRRYALSDPGGFLAGLGGKALRFAGSRELPRNTDPYLFGEWSALLRAGMFRVGPFGFPFGLLLPLAAVGLAVSWKRVPGSWKLYLLSVPGAVILVFVSARYRVPVVPVLAVLAAAGAAWIAGAVGTGRLWQRPGESAALAAGVAAIVLLQTLPGPFPEETGPYRAELLTGVAQGHQAAGRTDEARAAYLAAIARAPEHAPAYDGLGTLVAAAEGPRGGIPYFREAVARDPGFARAQYNLGTALRETGDLAGAEAALDRAVEIWPGYRQAREARDATAEARRVRREWEQDPESPRTRAALAWLLVSSPLPDLRDAARARELAEAVESSAGAARADAASLAVVANVWARLGDADRARSATDRALALARAEGKPELAARLEEQRRRAGR